MALRTSGHAASAIGATILLASCGSININNMSIGGGSQGDNFRARMESGCTTIRDCQALEEEAQRRVMSCEPNVVGRVPCSTANEDANEVSKRLAALRAKERDADGGGAPPSEADAGDAPPEIPIR